MISRWLLSLLLLALTTPALAQDPVPDTTSAWRYYPLAVGNVWEYRNTDEFGLRGYTRHTITGDTLIEGRRYFVRLQEQFDADGLPAGTSTQEVRFDTLTASVKAWWVTDERTLTCRLDADFESKTTCFDLCDLAYVYGGYDQTFTIGASSVTATVKSYDTGGCEAGYAYAAGIGELGQSFWYASSTLVYARLGGVAYGEPFPVAAEAGPEPRSALSLVVRPNPSAGAATVALTVRRPQRVTVTLYDVLGRRVASLHEGALGAGAHAFPLGAAGLPSGTYVARAAGEDGVATARAVIR